MITRRIITIAVTLLSAALFINAQRQRTTMQGKLVPAAENLTMHDSINTATCDTITGKACDDIVRLSGYDKPISATRETMHVTNLSDSLTVTGIELVITYLDRASRELHRRTITLNHTIDPKHTELVTFPSWDIQRSFYYIKSVKPRRQATPYDVRCNIVSITVTR